MVKISMMFSMMAACEIGSCSDEIESLLQATQSTEITVDGDIWKSRTLDIDAEDVKMSMSAKGELQLEGKHEVAIEEEECTGKDFWIWLGEEKEQATDNNEETLWAPVKQSSSEFSSGSKVFYAHTKRQTCNEWCEAQGHGQCVRGMDDAHHQSSYAENDPDHESKCTLWPAGHDRKSEDEAGCLQRWQTQICACAEVTCLSMNAGCQHCSPAENEDPILIRACDVIAANPNDPYGATEPVDFLLRHEGTSDAEVTVNSVGNFEISADCDEVITGSLTVGCGATPATEIILPPGFSYFVQPKLKPGQTFIVTDASVLSNSEQGLTFEYQAEPHAAIEFVSSPSFKVCDATGGKVEIGISVSPKIVSNCVERYTAIRDDYKCKYQDQVRLWRRVDQTLEDCYELCASTPECKFFSYDDSSDRWNMTCMGCTELPDELPGEGHTSFTFYQVCKRSDVSGQCEQHEEHKCDADAVLKNGLKEGLTALQCRDTCAADGDCTLFAYDGSLCQLCQNHDILKGTGTDSHWAVMGADCKDDEVIAKFGE